MAGTSGGHLPKTIQGIDNIEKQIKFYSLKYSSGENGRLYILNAHVFRYYMSPTGEFLDYPKPHNPDDKAKIVEKNQDSYGYDAFNNSTLRDAKTHYIVETEDINIIFDKISGTMAIHDSRKNKDVFNEFNSLSYEDHSCTQTITQSPDEYFFGGGMQNGRFTHKEEVIDIVNTNNWVDGGVTSPCPFYWSTHGYGVLRNTWQPGLYDFGAYSSEIIQTSHEGIDFDAYFFINSKPRDILRDYYELTGNPLMMPEYAFYEAHLNAFNRDYWVEVTSNTRGAILFEDGKYYKCYQPKDMDGNQGILESLNGEKDNYQFSARAMIDRYKRHDMPLGWFIPNDGYGSGYGQTDTLEGDIDNLKQFSDYAAINGVEVALWTESNLEPIDLLNPKKGDRDLAKEVSVANTVALKCDVAWIGSGYSFAFSAVENASRIFVKNTTRRPLIIMVDGWAGTQRHSGIWSGDQTGGQWEYIRFHIPTYVGSGLSGMPIVGSDMDGIYGGDLREVNVRDYQWKSFTPLQLNMDGWGRVSKSPFSFDEEATSINRAYLKLKAMLLPYNYSLAYEATQGLPMVRGMFLEYPNENSSYTNDSKYQFMWGSNILVAPIYNSKKLGDVSVRDGVYLPKDGQIWIDLFTGERFQGGKIYNNILTPLWKIPVFIKDGSIIPMTNPNNNPCEVERENRIYTIYPNGKSSYVTYEDDGISRQYLEGQNASTEITVIGPKSNSVGDLLIKIGKTNGDYKGMIKKRTTILQIMSSKNVNNMKIAVNGENLTIEKVHTEEMFNKGVNCFYFTKNFFLNPFMKEFSNVGQKFLLIKIETVDIVSTEINVKIRDYSCEGFKQIFGKIDEINPDLETPCLRVDTDDTTPTSVTMEWDLVKHIDYYEVLRDGVIFTNITDTKFTFDSFTSDTEHAFKIRSVKSNKASNWSELVKAKTREDPFKHIIPGVKVTCNLPCQPNQEVFNIANTNPAKIWHTHWTDRGQAKSEPLKLKFDLNEVYDVAKVDYFPRGDAGNGTFLELQYKYSINNEEWSSLSEIITFNHNSKTKTIDLNARFRYIEFIATKTVGDFGSGKHMLFYKK
ncbi:alpha-glucosidase 2-like [Pieris napi]|uniref:alpha-glucosidase 2-like n=1 Tax=Pieris napi TaxID=78633 RepID=UPI001FB8D5D7|nr:alpha-glucosidase 2-like [Pieris napi]